MPKSKSRTSSHHENNAKAVISILVLLVALGVFFIFKTYQENILGSSSPQTFMILTAVFFGLLVGLLFLINNTKKS